MVIMMHTPLKAASESNVLESYTLCTYVLNAYSARQFVGSDPFNTFHDNRPWTKGGSCCASNDSRTVEQSDGTLRQAGARPGWWQPRGWKG